MSKPPLSRAIDAINQLDAQQADLLAQHTAAVTRLTQLNAAEAMPLYSYGHSIAAGWDLPSFGISYASRVGSRVRSSSVVPHGVAGDSAPETLCRLIGFDYATGPAAPVFTPGSHGLILLETGLNEVLHQTDSAKLAQDAVGFGSALRSILRYFGTSAWHGHTDDYAGCTFGGTWAPALTGFAQTIGSAATVTIAFSAGQTSIYVGLVVFGGTNTMTAAITGGTATVNLNPSNLAEHVGNEANGGDWQFHVVRVPVSLSATSITVTLPNGGYFWGFGTEAAAKPQVVILKDGYRLGNNGSLGDTVATAQMATINQVIDQVCAEAEFSAFSSVVDVAPVLLDPTLLNQDNLHPSIMGHLRMADLVYPVVNQLTPRVGLSG